jgi:hypothetical protein
VTKKLAELFQLPEQSDKEEPPEHPSDAQEITTDALTTLEKIESALPQIRGLEASDVEMDELASNATSSYKDLMDLGMQVDSRFSSEIFSVAATMLGHAITAKTAKMNKKLKQIDLQLKLQALQQKAAEKDKEIDAIPLGEGKAFDRNELLKMMSDRRSNSASK